MAKTKAKAKTGTKAAKRKRHRPEAKPMPPQIEDTPENVARALFNSPPSTNKKLAHGNGENT